MYQPSIVIIPLWFVFVYQLGLLSTHRYVMARTFIPQDVWCSHRSALMRMFALGRRFDTKVLAIVLGVPLLISSIVLYFTPHVAAGLSGVIGVFCLILNGIIVGNFYYFKTYNNYYDIFMFGLVEDDTQAVLKNIYDDYPIIQLALGVLISALLPAWFIYEAVMQQWFASSSLLWQSILCLLSLLGLVFAARGAVRSKPLGRGHAQVSSLSVINKMVPDGLTAMSWAWSDRRRQISFATVTVEEGVRLLSDCLTTSSPESSMTRAGQTEDLSMATEVFYHRTTDNAFLSTHQPHVVFALMESFATNFLIYDDEKHNDLLGALRPYWQKDFVFERFCSDYNGTAPSLANIFFHSYVQNISQSIAQNKSLQETPFEVYKAKGYKTVFITAGNMMWRNLANYLPLQGVDAMYDQNSMIEQFPEAKQSLSYWGIADEYAFKMAEKLLKESQEPLFIAILSMTNHPPYVLPSHYTPLPLRADCLTGRYGNNDEERLLALGTYQYACDALGRFIQTVDNSYTIVAATGDHHVRGVYADMPKELFASKAVPFFVHIPAELRKQLAIDFDAQQLGSHKDIMPTLYHLSLSDARYWHGGGQPLLMRGRPSHCEPLFEGNFAYNETLFATEKYVVDTSAQPLVAYQWGENLEVGQEYLLSEEERRQVAAFQQFLVWQTNYLVQNQ